MAFILNKLRIAPLSETGESVFEYNKRIDKAQDEYDDSEEVAEFLKIRASSGQPEAVRSLLMRAESRTTNEVPRIEGMDTTSGQSQATMIRTASLYRGNAGLNPPTDDAI